MTFTLTGVTFSYPGAKAPALRDLTLTIPAGQTTVLLGPSGSGKSTLLYVLGLLWGGALDAGSIQYHAEAAAIWDYARLAGRPHEQAGLRLHEFGFVLQSSYLLPHFTCAQNIMLPLTLQGYQRQQREQVVERLLRQADVDPDCPLMTVKDRLAGAVAGGQRQRMAVLRAVVHNPRVVFADEPFSNLDPRNSRNILQLLHDWRVGTMHPEAAALERTLILVCHDVGLARRHAGQVVLLVKGRLVGVPFARHEWSERAADLERLFGV